jgi:hypothetical protein
LYGTSCKGIDEECQDAGYDYGIAKWEWEEPAWQPEGDPAGTLVTGDDLQATYDSGLDDGTIVAAAIVVKAATQREVIQGGSGTVYADDHALSHITFCGLDTFCGDGIKDDDEQCDGTDGLIDGFYCTSNCELTPLTPVCPLSEDEYDFIMDFNSVRIRTDSGLSNSQTTIHSLSIPQGDYQVTLVAHDAYLGRESVSQPKEYYQLLFLEDETQLALSSAHTDLTDHTNYVLLTEIVDDVLALPAGITGVRAIHPAYPDSSSANSLNVVCAGLVDVTIHSFCGDGVVDDDEACDVGESNGEVCVPSYSDSCEYCSATCELITVPGPYCGDGVVQESYETCDAGQLNGVACTPSYDSSCEYCSTICEPITVPGPYCGDGIVNGEEACDGSAPEGYSCTPQCTLEPIVDCLNLSYIAPYFTNGSSQWIDTASRVALTYDAAQAVCVQANHYYKATPAPDAYCLTACSAWEPKSTYWSAYEQPFGLAQESCYVIEYYSSFEGVNSSLLWDCVFVDKTSPQLTIVMDDAIQDMSEINRELGSNFYPELALDNSFCDISPQHCVDITMNTSVLLSCEDTATYASGVDTLCFAVDFDGDDITSAYCDAYGGEITAQGCCIAAEPSVKLYFGEESWHKLTTTCVDNVNKSSSTTRYLKVEGFDFEIILNKKWNLISFPYRLINDSLDAVFAGLEDSVAGVWTYHNGSWFGYEPGGVANNLDVAKPGWGYWVLALQEDVLRVRGSMFNSLLVPPQKEIFKGWNLVGYYGVAGATTGQNGLAGYYEPLFQGKTVGCALQSLAASVFHHPSSSILSYWELFNPDAWIEFSLEDRMDPGAGYWVFAYDDGLYVPSTICS